MEFLRKWCVYILRHSHMLCFFVCEWSDGLRNCWGDFNASMRFDCIYRLPLQSLPLFHFPFLFYAASSSAALPSPSVFFYSHRLCVSVWVCDVCVVRHQRCHAIRMPLHVKSQQRHTTCLWQFPFCSKQKCITNWFESFCSCLSFFFLLHHSQRFLLLLLFVCGLIEQLPGLFVCVCRSLSLFLDTP